MRQRCKATWLNIAKVIDNGTHRAESLAHVPGTFDGNSILFQSAQNEQRHAQP